MIGNHDDRKLLEPGWPGALSNSEMDYVKKRLHDSKRLRNKWGFGERDDSLSEKEIALVAAHGAEALQNEPVEREILSIDTGFKVQQGRLF